MNAVDRGGQKTRRRVRALAWLALAALATSCTVYKVKDMDGRALAAKGKRGRIVSVHTAERYIVFSEKDPAEVKDGAVVGSLRMIYTLDPFDIAEITTSRAGPKIVLKDGTRFRAAASKPVGERVECEAVQAVYVPLDEVVRAKVKTVNTAASILGTLAGAVLVVGALAIDAVTYGDDVPDFDETLTGSLIGSLFESDGTTSSGSGRRRSNKALLGEKESYDTAEETEFWTMEWTPVDGRPGEDGKLRLKVDNSSVVPRGVDEAKLVVVDHPPEVFVAPDVLGTVRAYSHPVVPESATDAAGKDVKELVSATDGILWRTEDGESSPGSASPIRDEITVSFPKPKGARRAKLIVNAANSRWRAEFAREVQARQAPATPNAPPVKDAPKAGSVYQDWEYGKVQVRMLTAFGWQTGQVLFAVGPLLSADVIYNLDLDDVGTDKVWLKLTPPAGYWLFDRLALDYSEDGSVEAAEVAAEEVDGPDAADVLKALASEDGSTLHLGAGDPPAHLTFTVPPPKEGMARSVFLRTVSCYEMPPDPKERKSE